MSRADRALYDRMIADHLAEIERQSAAQRARLDLVLAGLTPGVSAPELVEPADAILPEKIRAVAERIRRVHKAVVALFAYTNNPPEGRPETLAAELDGAGIVLALEVARLRQGVSK